MEFTCQYSILIASLLLIQSWGCQAEAETVADTSTAKISQVNKQEVLPTSRLEQVGTVAREPETLGGRREEELEQNGEEKFTGGHSSLTGVISSDFNRSKSKCITTFDFTHFGDGSTSASKSPQIIPDGFSFAIGDIDMPIAPPKSSIDSAIKLLSSLGNQFEPLDSDSVEEPEDNLIKFRENRLQIRGLDVTMLNIHIYTDNEPKFGIGVTVRNMTLSGRFSYVGPLSLTGSRLSGYYRMSIDNIYLTASTNLTKGVEIQHGVQAEKKYNLVTNDFAMNITSLGYITIGIMDSSDFTKPTANYLLKMLQRFLQKTIKRTYYTFENYIRKTLESESRRWLDYELTRYKELINTYELTNTTGKKLVEPSVSTVQEDLVRIISNEILSSHMQSVSLPDYQVHQNILGSQANVEFFNGSLSGLDQIKLTGETKIKQQEEHLLVNASIGWSDIKPYYNWNLTIGSGKNAVSRGFVSFLIKDIEFDAMITAGIRQPPKLVVEQLVIRRLDTPKMDIGGLPGMNRLTRSMVNFFMGRLKQRLVSSIQPVLRLQLEKLLNKMISARSSVCELQIK